LIKYGKCIEIRSDEVTFSLQNKKFDLKDDTELEYPFYIFLKQKTTFNEMYREAKREKDTAKAMAAKIVPQIISTGVENVKEAIPPSDGGKRKSLRNKKVTKGRKPNSKKVKKLLKKITRKSRKH
jgi:hypothetical protein